MSAKWLWGTTPIYVSSEDISRELKRAELFVLDATESIFVWFGAGSRKITLQGIVIGDTDKNAIDADAIGDTTRALTTPWGTVTGCKINGAPKFTAKMYSGGTIDGTSYTSSVTPLYDTQLEIIVTA